MPTKIQMTADEAIRWMLLGIKNGQVKAAQELGEDFIKQHDKKIKEEIENE